MRSALEPAGHELRVAPTVVEGARAVKRLRARKEALQRLARLERTRHQQLRRGVSTVTDAAAQLGISELASRARVGAGA